MPAHQCRPGLTGSLYLAILLASLALGPAFDVTAHQGSRLLLNPIGEPDETAHDDPGGTERQPAGTSDLLIKVYTCSVAPMPGQGIAYYLQGGCTPSAWGINFTVTSPYTTSTKTITVGQNTWHALPDGPITVQQHTPSGYTDPVVFCSFYGTYNGAYYHSVPVPPIPAPGGAFTWEIPFPDSHSTCHVFNFLKYPPDPTPTPPSPRGDHPDGKRPG